MSGAATLPRYNTVPWSAGTWNDCVKSSQSALRWDIKNSMKSLCKRLTEVGEECFIVTVNIHNGWVGHIGTLKGDEYIEDKSEILWDFLHYCRETDCIDSSTSYSNDESEGDEEEEGEREQLEKKDETDSTETDEWEPDEWVPAPDQSDRSLRSHDHQKACSLEQTRAALQKILTNANKTTKRRLSHPRKLPGSSKSSAKNHSSASPSSCNKSQLKGQSACLNSRRNSLTSNRNSRDTNLLRIDVKFLNKKSLRKKTQLKRCSQCCQVFKHDNIYKEHMKTHQRRKSKRKLFQNHCHKCSKEFNKKRTLYNHVLDCKKRKTDKIQSI